MASLKSEVKKNHAGKILSALNRFRAWDHICDFTIQVENENIAVHRSVLAACSDYFFNLLKNDHKVAKEGVLVIKDHHPRIIIRCIEFVYTGEAGITLQNVDQLLQAALMFKFTDLVRLCFDFLLINLSPDNCCTVKTLLEKHNRTDEVSIVEDFIIDNFEHVIDKGWFLTLSKERVSEYLKSPKIDHELIWKCVTSWVNFSLQERQKSYFEFLSLNAHKFSAQFLLSDVWDHEITQALEPCKELVINSLFNNVESFQNVLTFENCFQARQVCLGSRHVNSEQIYNHVVQFLIKNFERVADDERILDLSNDEIMLIFRSPKTRYSSEITKWEVAVRWVKHEPENRKKHFLDLMRAMKLENLPLNFLQDVVRAEPLVRELSECVEMVTDAFYAHANPEKLATKKPNTLKKNCCISESENEDSGDSDEIPQKKTRRNSHVDPSCPVENANVCLAVYDRSSGKVTGLNLGTREWKPVAVTKVTCVYHGIVSVDGKLYILKGKTLHRLDLNRGWKKLKSKVTRTTIAAKLIGLQDIIYVMESDSVSFYDINDDAWLENLKFSAPDGFCACASRHFIYALGGRKDPTKAIQYDILCEESTVIKPMMVERHEAAAVVLDQNVYVMGGVLNPTGVNSSLQTECYNPSTDTWSIVANMQVQRSNFYACTHNEKIYAVGGEKDAADREKMDSIEVYCAENGKYTWKLLCVMPKLDPSFTTCIVEI